MARRQRHLIEISDVPRTDDETPRMRIVFNSLDDLLELINVPLGVLSCTLVQRILRPLTPLIAINRPQLSLRVSPGIPDRRVLGQVIMNVRRATHKPQQFAYYSVEQDFFRGQ